MKGMNILCLDAEFAENEELLELSVYNANEKEVYHSYYKPENIQEWRTDIHHITPEMVKNERPFRVCRDEVQNLLNGSTALTGFAVDNDLRVLLRSGVTRLDEMTVIDVKDMYWFLKGRAEEMSPFSVPSLLVCSAKLGLDFSEEDAHSASADTLATVRCFNLLMKEFCESEGIDGDNGIHLFGPRISEAKAQYVEDGAKGYVKVFKNGEFHKVKYGHMSDVENKALLFEVAVNDRYKAEYEIRKILKKKEVPGRYSIYKLTPKLLDDIKKYNNTYDAEESAWCKKIVRNLSRLTL